VLYAVEQNRLDIVRLLIQHGADINLQDNDGVMIPLTMATWRGYYDIVEELLKCNADVNSIDDGRTSLHYAIDTKQVEIVQLLLDYGADVQQCTLEGKTPLMLANHSDNKQIIKMIELRMCDIMCHLIELIQKINGIFG
jgi:ankyrin repeat protein